MKSIPLVVSLIVITLCKGQLSATYVGNSEVGGEIVYTDLGGLRILDLASGESTTLLENRFRTHYIYPAFRGGSSLLDLIIANPAPDSPGSHTYRVGQFDLRAKTLTPSVTFEGDRFRLWPVWLPGGPALACADKSAAFKISLKSGEASLLFSYPPAGPLHPAGLPHKDWGSILGDFSPDGETFYTSMADGGVYAIHLANNASTFLTRGFSPKASPSGHLLALFKGRLEDLESRNLVQKVAVLDLSDRAETVILTTSRSSLAYIQNFVWSPDSSFLAVLEERDTGYHHQAVYYVRVIRVSSGAVVKEIRLNQINIQRIDDWR